MRNKVIKFLSELPASPVAQFNEALQLFIQTPGHNVSVVKYYNAAGFSDQRLLELLYDLKAANEITAADLVSAPQAVMAVVADDTPGVQLPEFSKGAKGNTERKAYCAEHGLTPASNKNADLDAAILEHLNKLELEVEVEVEVEVEAKTREEYIAELASINTSGEIPSEEFLEGMKTALGLSDEDFKTFMVMTEAASKGIDAALEKVGTKNPAAEKK